MSFQSHRMKLRVAAAAALGAAGFARTASAQADYPNRPVRLIVPWPVGGATDIIARLMAERLQEQLGQSIVVDNRPGATGYIGTQAALQAPPDGYTLLMMAATVHSFSPAVMKKMPFDPIKDFLPISQVVTFPYVLIVPADSPYKSVGDILRAARAEPNKIAYGSFGNGSAAHLITELLSMSSGAQMQHIPYKGGAQAMTDLLGGQFAFMIDSLPQPLPHIKSGKVRGLAVTSPARASSIPEVPTLSETLPGFQAISWLGVGGSPNLPPAVAARIGDALRRMASHPTWVERLRNIGADPATSASPDAFRSFLETERQRWSKVVADAKIPQVE
jgi:tripartite-type tricarboxylate transporter receptor subunit TctC